MPSWLIPFTVRRTRLFLLIASLLLHLGIFLLIMNIRVGGKAAPREEDRASFAAEMKIPTQTVPLKQTELAGGASGQIAPMLISPEVPPAVIATTSPVTPIFSAPLTPISTLHSLTKVLNNLTETERAGHGTGLGINIGGVTVNGDEKLGVVLDTSGSMTSILPPIRQTLADHFGSSPVTESANSLGEYIPFVAKRPSENGIQEADLYQCCYKLLDQGVTAIYIFTDFEDGEDKKATEALVADLRKAGVKLYLCYTEGPPYAGLVAYTRESGGDCKKFVREKKEP